MCDVLFIFSIYFLFYSFIVFLFLIQSGVLILMMQLARSNRVVTVVILAMVVTVVAVNVGLCLCLDRLSAWLTFGLFCLVYAHVWWLWLFVFVKTIFGAFVFDLRLC